MAEAPSPPPEEADQCGVPGCTEPAHRHLALAEAKKGLPELPEKGRRIGLCRTHYKAWKKATKESRTLSRLGR